MRGKTFDPRHLDVEAFAERGGAVEGHLLLAGLTRLAGSLHSEAPPGTHEAIAWHAKGERRVARGKGTQTWLELTALCRVPLTCQRCLQVVEVPMSLGRSYRFVADEASAAEADIDAEEDVLVSTHSLNLEALIEDELLLALPLVPRHEGVCPQPLVAAADSVEPALAAPLRDHPFEALAALKPRKAIN